jgi:hypothetical protein
MGSITAPPRENAATKLRALLASPGPIILAPGVYDGFSARIALSVGFDTIYMVQRIASCAIQTTYKYRPGQERVHRGSAMPTWGLQI